jgi:hypothetical protein
MGDTMWADTQTYQRNVNHYPKLKDIQSQSELAARLSDLSRYIESQTSTISGMEQQMKKSLKTLHENGYMFVTRENYLDFGKFMEEYRKQKLDEMGYSSGDAYDTYTELEVHRVDPTQVQKDFEFWLANKDLLEKLPTGSGGEIKESTLRNRMLKLAAKIDAEVFGATPQEIKKYGLKKEK